MAVLGPSVLQNLYEEFLNTELTFSKDVVAAIGSLPTESSLKWQGTLFPCLIHAATFRAAKVLVRVSEDDGKRLELGSKAATLTLTYLHAKTAKKELYQFNGNVQILQQYPAGGGSLSLLVSIVYNHRPPEGFLQIHAAFLNLKKEANQRREDRIPLNGDAKELLGLTNLNTTVSVDAIDRKCLIRELSYSGARAILTGIAPFLVDRKIALEVPFADGKITIPGTIVRAEPLEGHKGLAMIALGYEEDQVPVEYLRALQKGFKLGLGVRKEEKRITPTTSREAQTSSINLKTLKVVRPR